MRERCGILTQRAIGLRQRRVTPIAHHRVHQRIRTVAAQLFFIDLCPEVVRVRLCSVTTVELCGHHRGQQLALES